LYQIGKVRRCVGFADGQGSAGHILGRFGIGQDALNLLREVFDRKLAFWHQHGGVGRDQPTGVGSLFVADGSVFPHSVRVNPMLSIMAAADYATRSIAGVRPAAEITEGPAYRARQHAAQDGARGASA